MYQCGRNNAAADTLSQVNELLNAQEVKAILDKMTVGCSNQAELRVLVGQWGKEEEWVWVSAAMYQRKKCT